VLIIVLAAGLVLGPGSALAHKLNVFAWVEGRKIIGEAYFRGRAPLVGGAVTVFGPGDEKLGQTTTDAAGRFQFEPKLRGDHRLLVDTGDGHSESFTVTGAELPADLPAAPSGKQTTAPPSVVSSPPIATDSSATSGAQAQIALLRAELQEFRHEIRVRDVLGGLGYIVGLMGVAFYFLGVRRHAPRVPASSDDSRR
jgi:nickel transport protein